MPYYGRPGPSPVIAALRAVGFIRSDTRVLDVGCGTGVDAVALGLWGVRRVVGIDSSRYDIADARRRRTAMGLSAKQVEFVVGDMTRPHAELRPRSFDLALDTLVAQNIPPVLRARYAARLHELLVPGGVVLLQQRYYSAAGYAVRRADTEVSPSFHRFFRFDRAYFTDLCEEPQHSRHTGRLRIAVIVGERRNRRRGESRR